MDSERGQSSLADWGLGTEVDKDLEPWKSPDVLQRLCYEEDMTVGEIATRFGCTWTSVKHWVDKFGIDPPIAAKFGRRRSENPASHSFNARGYEEWQMMTDEGVRQVFVHRLVAVSEYGLDATRGKIVHHRNGVPWDNRPSNLELMTQSEHAQMHADEDEQGEPQWRDKGTLQELYVEEEMTLAKIGNKLGCSEPTVLRWMEKHGIERRSSN